MHQHMHHTGHTEDMIEYLHKSVPVTMLADLKDSMRNNRDINIMDKYGATAVSRSIVCERVLSTRWHKVWKLCRRMVGCTVCVCGKDVCM